MIDGLLLHRRFPVSPRRSHDQKFVNFGSWHRVDFCMGHIQFAGQLADFSKMEEPIDGGALDRLPSENLPTDPTQFFDASSLVSRNAQWV